MQECYYLPSSCSICHCFPHLLRVSQISGNYMRYGVPVLMGRDAEGRLQYTQEVRLDPVLCGAVFYWWGEGAGQGAEWESWKQPWIGFHHLQP